MAKHKKLSNLCLVLGTSPGDSLDDDNYKKGLGEISSGRFIRDQNNMADLRRYIL